MRGKRAKILRKLTGDNKRSYLLIKKAWKAYLQDGMKFKNNTRIGDDYV